MKILPQNKNLQYCGRIDWENPVQPVFIYPCTSVAMRFKGEKLQVYLKNNHLYWDNFVGLIVDGVQISFKLPNHGEVAFDIPLSPNFDQIHEVLLFKRQDACHELAFLGFELEDDGEILPLPPLPTRKIEVYGDSVSAGEVSEAIEYIGKKDPEHQGEYSNSYYSYAWMTARKLQAQIHDIAQGGIALLDGTGWYNAPNYIGMESIWDSLHYTPAFGEPVKWDFSKYTPDVIIVALGQNDSHPDDYMAKNPSVEKAVHWRTHYQCFLQKLRKQYPNAYMICCTTLLNHSSQWDLSIEQVVKQLNDPLIHHYTFLRNGKGTPGHLRISEAEEMAEELSQYILTLPIKAWEEQ